MRALPGVHLTHGNSTSARKARCGSRHGYYRKSESRPRQREGHGGAIVPEDAGHVRIKQIAGVASRAMNPPDTTNLPSVPDGDRDRLIRRWGKARCHLSSSCDKAESSVGTSFAFKRRVCSMRRLGGELSSLGVGACRVAPRGCQRVCTRRPKRGYWDHETCDTVDDSFRWRRCRCVRSNDSHHDWPRRPHQTRRLQSRFGALRPCLEVRAGLRSGRDAYRHTGRVWCGFCGLPRRHVASVVARHGIEGRGRELPAALHADASFPGAPVAIGLGIPSARYKRVEQDLDRVRIGRPWVDGLAPLPWRPALGSAALEINRGGDAGSRDAPPSHNTIRILLVPTDTRLAFTVSRWVLNYCKSPGTPFAAR